MPDPKHILNYDPAKMGPRRITRAWAKTLAEVCPPVPGGGPDKAELDAIIGDARHIGKMHDPRTGLEGLAAAAILAKNSKTDGRWDVKNARDSNGQRRFAGGPKNPSRASGNFLYGATSTAMGFSPFISDLGADIYSLAQKGELENEDRAIHRGQLYARLGCDRR